MKVLTLRGRDEWKFPELFDEAFRLRHKTFVEEMGWEAIRKPDGRERDQFDHDEAVHFMMLDGGKLASYSRLIPTTRPHLLSDIYPQLAPRGYPKGDHVWEWTRWTTAWPYRRQGLWSFEGGAMLHSVAQYAMQSGIRELSLQGHPTWITRFLQVGYMPRPLGIPEQVHGEPVVAFVLPLTPTLLQSLEDRVAQRTSQDNFALLGAV